MNLSKIDWSFFLPSTEQVCKAHQKEWDDKTNNHLDEFLLKCDMDKVDRKNAAGTLEHSDIVYCYRPQCNPTNDQYTTKQCSYLHQEWCWCSSPDGYAIPDTFQKNMPDGYCCKWYRIS